MNRPTPPPPPDLREHGGGDTASDRRLFMQLQVFTGCIDVDDVVRAVRATGLAATVYEDLNDPHGIGVLILSEDPETFLGKARGLYRAEPFASLTHRPELTMIGRTYAIGYERDLDETLLHRPTRHALSPAWPWAVWYPLRRSGRFVALPRDQQNAILKEHGTIGFAFGAGDYAHDIRLACQGLDQHDNDFTIGLVGKDLAPLSQLVQAMRQTTQTSQYLERLGPFFVGRAAYQSEMPSDAAPKAQ